MPDQITVSVYKPTITPATPLYVPRGTYLYDLSVWLSELSLVSSASGGFLSASFSFQSTVADALEWLADGINRHIDIYSKSTELAWSGFVDRVSISLGPASLTKGALLDVSNRVSVSYTPILDASVDPMVTGDQTVTTIADDEDSIALYGVLEEVRSGGTALTADAEQHRDTYLADTSFPTIGQTINTSGGGNAVVTVDALGYIYRLKKFVYADATAGTTTATAKITDVLTADPNGLFSTDYSHMQSNASLAPLLDDTNRIAWDVVQGVVSIGDAAYNRWTFGVYENEIPYYAAMPSAVEYNAYVFDPALGIYDLGGTPVDPVLIRPARWLFIGDIQIGNLPTGNFRLDLGYMFIETVEFNYAETIINGIRLNSISQLLARQGISGQ